MDCSTPGSYVLYCLLDLFRFMSIELVMLSNHFIFCCSLLLLPSIFHSIKAFSNESVLCIRWPKYWSIHFTINPSSKYSELISFRINWFDLLAVQGVLKSLLQHHGLKASAFFMAQLSLAVTAWDNSWGPTLGTWRFISPLSQSHSSH